MAPDDVHDLFDTGRADESDGSTDEDRSDESDGAAERSGFPPLSDDGPAEPAERARDEAAESTSPRSGTSVEDTGGFEMGAEEAEGGFEMGAEEAEGGFEMGGRTTTSPDDDGFELAESTTSSTGLVEDDTDELEPAGEPSTERPVEEDTDELEPTASTEPSGGAAHADAAASESPPETASEGAVRDDAGGSGSAGTAGSPSTEPSAGRVDQDGADRPRTTEPARPAADETDEPGSSPADRGASASAGATTSTDDSLAVDDEQGTAGPEEPRSRPSGAAVDGEVADPPGSNRLSTGIDVLDEAMGGGVPPGRLVVLVADPGVQSELIVDSVLAQRDTLYVTTDRPDWEVQKDIEPGLGSGEVVIRDHSPDSLLSGLDSLLEELDTSSNFVLDSVNELELVPRNRYRVFLSDVKRRLFDTGSIGLLTGVTVGHESARDLTLRRADVVWRLETRTKDHEIENLLSVPKFRGGAAMTETVKLELTDEVRVDTSWNEG